MSNAQAKPLSERGLHHRGRLVIDQKGPVALQVAEFEEGQG